MRMLCIREHAARIFFVGHFCLWGVREASPIDTFHPLFSVFFVFNFVFNWPKNREENNNRFQTIILIRSFYFYSLEAGMFPRRRPSYSFRVLDVSIKTKRHGKHEKHGGGSED